MSVKILHPDFREGTHTEVKDIFFDFRLEGEVNAALGDMICWLPAIKYICEKINYINVHLVTPKWFHNLAKNALRDYSVSYYDEYPDIKFKEFGILRQVKYPVNATSMHLIDLGFLYYLSTTKIETEYRVYTPLDLESVPLKSVLKDKIYAVMTPCYSADNRKLLVNEFNKILDHLISKGITPVFLGEKNMGPKRDIRIDDYDLSKGINLIGKTTLLEAAKIMKMSEMVIGVDNGLLHLAAMTDATILYGYTIAGPFTRRVYRDKGKTYELYGDKEKIKCLFCQENVRFIGKNFSTCLYEENEPQCVKALNAESFIATIDMHLGGGDGSNSISV